jgi:hypothetical protein
MSWLHGPHFICGINDKDPEGAAMKWSLEQCFRRQQTRRRRGNHGGNGATDEGQNSQALKRAKVRRFQLKIEETELDEKMM